MFNVYCLCLWISSVLCTWVINIPVNCTQISVCKYEITKYFHKLQHASYEVLQRNVTTDLNDCNKIL